MIVVYNRVENIRTWARCWEECDQSVPIVVIHNIDKKEDREPMETVCREAGFMYHSRPNKGFDIGAFQDVINDRLPGFPEWTELLWLCDDTMPMQKDFARKFFDQLVPRVGVVCMEISPHVRTHIRTSGFALRKEVAKRLKFPCDPVVTKADCFHFEHRGGAAIFYDQIIRMGLKVIMAAPREVSPLWDVGYKRKVKRQAEFEKIFPKKLQNMSPASKRILITTVFDKNYKEAGKTLFNSIRRHTDCTGVDFKVITPSPEVVNEFGKENCHFITNEIKARYRNVKYSKDLPASKYATSWYRYEIFNFTEYDRVICIDSDCICVKDISYLFSDELDQYDLVSVEDHIVSKCFVKLVPDLERQGLRLANLSKRMKEGKVDVQPALLVANKTIVRNEWYKKLLNYANRAPFSYSVDEGVLNDFIYMENLKIKLLPLEWDYQDIYEMVCPELPVPADPTIIHCQESKPFKKAKANLDTRMHKWHDLWWEENKPIQVKTIEPVKTIVAVIVWNRFENLRLWINCWNQCDKANAELVVVHNLESDNDKYSQLCKNSGVTYVPRENRGFDMGAFQDVCKERLNGFPNNWDNLIWVTDDCIPMSKDFVNQFLDKLSNGNIPCYELSNEVKTHIRTTGFLVTKDVSKKLSFPADPIEHREHCYEFEHKSKTAFYEQIVAMGKKPIMVNDDLRQSPLWDSGVRGYLNLMRKHEGVFVSVKSETPNIVINSILDDFAIVHKSDKSSRFHNYAVKYDKILSPFREAFSSILEIGVAQGQSIRMWTDYFTKATIHGADISKASENCVDYSDRIRFHLLDQRNEAQLKNLEQFSPFDLIIDDGNHFWMEQILTFKTLFPYLRKGGIYIVEDTTTSYWREYKNNPVSPIEYFKSLVDEVHLKGARGSVPANPPEEFGDWDRGWHRREDCHTNVPDFESIQFFNGFIVIYKR